MAKPQSEEDPALSPTQSFGGDTAPGDSAGSAEEERTALEKFDQEMLAQRIGQYRVLRRIGRGGMGMVYEAVHEDIGQRAAVKTLNQEYSANPAFVKRFLTEARVAVIAQHPGLVKVFDYGQLQNGLLYILMEFLEGETLATRLHRDGQLSLETATRLARQIASAVAEAHARDVLHRDLKPENTFLVRDREVSSGERVKILDFGLAKILRPNAVQPSQLSPKNVSLGGVVGTPAYMAPEQYRADAQISGKADVYSLGVLLFEMLAGRLPFSAESFGDLMLKHLTEPPPEISKFRADAPAALASLLGRMLAKNPDERPSMAEVEQALLEIDLHGPLAPAPSSVVPAPRRRLGLRGALGIGLALATLGASSTILYKQRHRSPAGVEAAGDMASFAGASYLLGSTAEEIAAAYVWCQRLVSDGCNRAQFDREFPTRQVALKPFLLDRYEVDNEHFAAWLSQKTDLRFDPKQHYVYVGDVLLADLYQSFGSGGIVQADGKFVARHGLEHRPATQVTWDGADSYCRAQGKRLPMETEWEVAARSGQRYLFPWGDDEPRCEGVAFARHAGWACGHLSGGPSDVGTSSQDHSAQGVHDLAGNVSEWVADRFIDSAHSEIDYRVVRGGDWHTPAAMCRAATRSRIKRSDVVANVGFRCAK